MWEWVLLLLDLRCVGAEDTLCERYSLVARHFPPPRRGVYFECYSSLWNEHLKAACRKRAREKALLNLPLFSLSLY